MPYLSLCTFDSGATAQLPRPRFSWCQSTLGARHIKSRDDHYGRHRRVSGATPHTCCYQSVGTAIALAIDSDHAKFTSSQ